MITILPILAEDVEVVWHSVEDYIRVAIASEEPNYDVDYAKRQVVKGVWELFVALDDKHSIRGASLVSYIVYPLHTVAFLHAIGGRIVTNKNTFMQFTALLKTQGATKIQGLVQPPMSRLTQKYGVNPIAILVESTV